MLELVNIGPNLGSPGLLMNRRFAATGTAGVQFTTSLSRLRGLMQLYENAADFLDLVLLPDHMLVSQ